MMALSWVWVRSEVTDGYGFIEILLYHIYGYCLIECS